MLKRYGILILLLFVISACEGELKKPLGCTKEAKLCPDGSGVGRNPDLYCEFDPCPDTVSCETDNDCTLVFPVTECCQSGCPEEAINKNSVAKVNNVREKHCSTMETSCPDYGADNPFVQLGKAFCPQYIEARCLNNKCKAVEFDLDSISEEREVAYFKIKNAEDCQAVGGAWVMGRSIGPGAKETFEVCVKRLEDGGKRCSDSSQCEGNCLAIIDKKRTKPTGTVYKDYGGCATSGAWSCWSIENGVPVYDTTCSVI